MTTGKTEEKLASANIARGETDRILECRAARVNGHILARCEGWEGPCAPEGRREGEQWYVFYACERCGVEAALPSHRWETIDCEPERDTR